MATIAELGIKVDTSQVKAAATKFRYAFNHC